MTANQALVFSLAMESARNTDAAYAAAAKNPIVTEEFDKQPAAIATMKRKEQVPERKETDNSDMNNCSDESSEEGLGDDILVTGSTELPIRERIEDLIRALCPEEANNLEAMFVQFANREEELLSTLQTMKERRAKVRARAATHKLRAKQAPRKSEGTSHRRYVPASSSSTFNKHRKNPRDLPNMYFSDITA